MAKTRITYEVNNEELAKSIQELKNIQKEAGVTEDEVNKLGKSYSDVDKETQKVSGSMSSLGKLVAGLGLAALATEAAKAFFNLSKEIEKSRRETALLTNESGANLDRLVAKIRATSQVFDKDYNEVLRAANTLSKEFGITTIEAVDQINDGFTRGLDINGEYLESLREYSTFVKEAGLDTEQFNAILQAQVTEGVFSDKGIDAIKEAIISLREMTPATQDALRAIGLNANQITREIQSGARTYFDVIQEISARTREATDPRSIGMVYADIFRGAGEDAGSFILKLDQIGQSMQDATGDAAAYQEQQEKLLKSQEDLERVFVALTETTRSWWQDLKQNAIKTAAEFFKLFVDHKKLIEGLSNETYVEFRNKTTEEIIYALSEANKALEQNKKWVEENDYALGRLSGTYRNSKERIDELQLTIDGLNMALEERKNQTREAADEVENDIIVTDTWSDSIEKATGKIDLITEAMKRMDSQLYDIGETQRRVNIGDFFESLGIPDELREERETAQKETEQYTEFVKEKYTEQAEANQMMRETILNGAIDLNNILSDLTTSRLRAELENQNLTEEERKRAMADLARAERRAAVFAIILNTARGVTAALATVPPNPVLAAIVGATGAIQLATVRSASLPTFHTGQVDIADRGEEFHAILKRRETVLRPEATIKYKPILEKMQKLELDPDIFTKGRDMSLLAYDLKGIEKALEKGFQKAPITNIEINERGFNVYQRKVSDSYSMQRKRLFG